MDTSISALSLGNSIRLQILQNPNLSFNGQSDIDYHLDTNQFYLGEQLIHITYDSNHADNGDINVCALQASTPTVNIVYGG